MQNRCSIDGLPFMQQSHEAMLQESSTQTLDLNQDLTATSQKASALEMGLCQAESSCRQAQEEAHQLRGQLEIANSKAQSACSTAQQAEMDCVQLRQALQQQSSTSCAAIAELDTRIADMASASTAQQEEILTLHATIQVILFMAWKNAGSPCKLQNLLLGLAFRGMLSAARTAALCKLQEHAPQHCFPSAPGIGSSDGVGSAGAMSGAHKPAAGIEPSTHCRHTEHCTCARVQRLSGRSCCIRVRFSQSCAQHN